jgi:hypothetical protein
MDSVPLNGAEYFASAGARFASVESFQMDRVIRATDEVDSAVDAFEVLQQHAKYHGKVIVDYKVLIVLAARSCAHSGKVRRWAGKSSMDQLTELFAMAVGGKSVTPALARKDLTVVAWNTILLEG